MLVFVHRERLWRFELCQKSLLTYMNSQLFGGLQGNFQGLANGFGRFTLEAEIHFSI